MLDRLPLIRSSFVIGSHTVHVEAARDQDALLAATADAPLIPFGLLLWESALPLADAVAARALAGLSVLELGAGVGLPGIIAALAGARVLQIDVDPLAVSLARHNAALNAVSDRVDVRLVDWNAWRTDAAFDLILGADVVYDRAHHTAVASLLARALAPSGTVLLSDPSRADTPAFLHHLRTTGWSVETTALATDDLTRPGHRVAVQLHDARRLA